MKLFSAIILLLGLYQPNELKEIRDLYRKAPVDKTAAKALDRKMLPVDSNAAPVLFCYKGANEMVQAKYALNPVVKLEKFNRGKAWITQALKRDSLDLEMHFIRFSIQGNLPAFLGYRDDISGDKKFLLLHIKDCRDSDLKKMVIDYLTAPGTLTPEELKQLDN